jgi:hypothetical protein
LHNWARGRAEAERREVGQLVEFDTKVDVSFLKWTCLFAPEQRDHKFGTNWTLMEQDLSSADDVVSATVEPHLHSATSGTATFIPSQKSNPAAVSFTHTRSWHQDDLDTELGGEELYAIVRLKDFTLMTPSETRISENLEIAP